MIKELYENALKGIDTRGALSKLRQEIKDDKKMNELFELVDSDIDAMKDFLHNEDPKTRKNAALLMGALDMSDFVECLIEGYKSEEQLFVRSAYLEALLNFDLGDYIGFFKEQIDKLSSMEVTEENKKHIGEELRCLTDIIIKEEGIVKHSFSGFNRTLKDDVEIILLTNKNHLEATLRQLEGREVEPIKFKGGVRLKTKKLREIKDIRTYSDILFAIPGFVACDFDPEKVANALASSDILQLLKSLHKSMDEPFYFRCELKCNLDLEKKSKFAKRFCAEVERLTNRELINSTSDYEIELRLIENKEGKVNALLKLYTIKDDRFDYLKMHSSMSIKPVNAALLVELTKEYMVEDAQVLDPFCGVGTLLVERQKVVKGNTSYGIDINAQAIEAAKLNTKAAEQIVHYINRDFFTFEHEYLFDEIFTDMPFTLNEKNEAELESVYRRFFLKARKVLKENGTIIMYSRNPGFANKYARAAGYNVIAGYPIAESTQLFVFR